MSLKLSDIWANNLLNVTRPPDLQIADGFVCGAVNQEYFNWIMYLVSLSSYQSVQTWNPTVAAEGGYTHPQMVVGSDLRLYATQFGGDFTINPVTDVTFIHWNLVTTGGGASELPVGYRFGFTRANNVGLPNTTIDIGAGAARSEDNTLDLISLAAMGKILDNVWAAGGTPGVPVGGRASAVALANGWYRLFIISTPLGVVDFGFDTDPAAANLLIDAVGYTKYRQVGSVLREAGAIVGFIHSANKISWKTPAVEVTTASEPIVATIRTLPRVPPHGKYTVGIMAKTQHNAVGQEAIRWSDADGPDIAPTSVNSQLIAESDAVGVQSNRANHFEIVTNSIAQVRTRASLAGIDHQAWVDYFIELAGSGSAGVQAGGLGTLAYVDNVGQLYNALSQVLTWNHGLGGEPNHADLIAECIVNDGAFVVGQRLVLTSWTQGGNIGLGIRITPTQVIVNTGNAAVRAFKTDGSGADQTLTLNRWRFSIKAVRFIDNFGGPGKSVTAPVTYLGAGQNHVLLHTLAVVPDIFQLKARCLIADLNYAIGDVVGLGFANENQGDATLTPLLTTTAIEVRIATGSGLVLANKTTLVGTLMTAGRWELFAVAYAG